VPAQDRPAVDPPSLGELQVLLTIMGGRVVYDVQPP
jgi:predicted amidohydrolase YtcJ